MSYTKIIGDWSFVFKDEESYLNARLEYLHLNLANSFIEFLRTGMFDHVGCTLEASGRVGYTSSTDESIYTVSTATAPQIPLTVEDLHNVYDAISDTNTSTMWTPNVISNMYNEYNVTFGSSNSCGEIPIKDFKSEKKNVKKDKPIESRFDILDL